MKFTRAIRLLSYFGKNLTVSDSLGTLRKALFRNDLMFVYCLEMRGSNPACLSMETEKEEGRNGVEIEKGGIAELEEFCARTGATAWEFNRHKFDGVKDFFVARGVDMIQSISWIYRRSDPNRFLILGERHALLQYGLTLPQFRGRGLYTAVQKAAAEYLYEQGVNTVFVLVESRNKASQRSQEKAGFVKVREMHLKKVLGVQVSRKLHASRIVRVEFEVAQEIVTYEY